MKLREAAPLVAILALSGSAFAQVTTSSPLEIPSCSNAHRGGRRIVSHLDIVEFYLPRFAKVKKVTDADYVEYFIQDGPKASKSWLKLMLGGQLGDNTPLNLRDTAISWTTKKWACQNDASVSIADWRGIGPEGRKWRYIGFPFGLATYADTPPRAADYFDKILGTICCGQCSTCKK